MSLIDDKVPPSTTVQKERSFVQKTVLKSLAIAVKEGNKSAK
jgi:hypothetical protein